MATRALPRRPSSDGSRPQLQRHPSMRESLRNFLKKSFSAKKIEDHSSSRSSRAGDRRPKQSRRRSKTAISGLEVQTCHERKLERQSSLTSLHKVFVKPRSLHGSRANYDSTTSFGSFSESDESCEFSTRDNETTESEATMSSFDEGSESHSDECDFYASKHFRFSISNTEAMTDDDSSDAGFSFQSNHDEELETGSCFSQINYVRFCENNNQYIESSVKAEDINRVWYSKREIARLKKRITADAKSLLKHEKEGLKSGGKPWSKVLASTYESFCRVDTVEEMHEALAATNFFDPLSAIRVGVERWAVRGLNSHRRTRRQQLWQAIQEFQSDRGLDEATREQLIHETCVRFSRAAQLFAIYLAQRIHA